MTTSKKPVLKPVFWSRTARPETTATPAGNREQDVYEVNIDERGHKSLIKTGKTNIYEKIQASLESTKIENIIRRATAGDPTALAQTTGQYLDITDAPRTLAEVQGIIIKMTNEFNNLPLDVRKMYDFSPEKYVADYGTENWMKNLGIKLPSQTEPTKPNEGGTAE